MWLLLNLTKDSDGAIRTVPVKEVSKHDVDYLYSLFHFVGAYNGSKIAKDIVVKNGESFKAFMQPDNLIHYQNNFDNAILEANRRCINYAVSLKSFIDITERYLLNDFDSNAKQRYHDEIQAPLFDSSFGYALFSKLRNYVVHRSFPYGSGTVHITGVEIRCSTERLLEWGNWTTIRNQIAQKAPYISLEEYVDEASSVLIAIWIQFISIFYGKEIETVIKQYSIYKRDNNVTGHIAFAEVDKREDIAKGFSMKPLPITELQECIKILQDNPCVTLSIT